MLYSATANGPFKVAGVHDPNSKRVIGIIYRPDAWQANTVYYQRSEDDYDIVVPSLFAGFYFKVTNPGKSGPTEPTWPSVAGGTVTDGSGCIWEAVAYNLLPPTDSIVDSTWTASDSVTIDQQSSTANTTQCRITAVPTGVLRFTLTNHTIKSNGEEDDITLQFKVGSR